MSKTAIIPKFKMSQLEKDLNSTKVNIEHAIMNTLAYVGEQCVATAREKGSYTDQTGNLRSSVGYAILRNGKIQHESTPKKYKDGDDGAKQIPATLKQLSKNFPKGLVLVVTAGMQYAWYVENYYGKDVLASSKLLAEKLVPKLLADIGIA